MTQLKLDFSLRPDMVDSGKKNEKITFTGSQELKEFIYQFASLQKISVSELIQHYTIKDLQEDLGRMLLTQANSDKTLGQLMRKP
jgi:hypothetical protein